MRLSTSASNANAVNRRKSSCSPDQTNLRSTYRWHWHASLIVNCLSFFLKGAHRHSDPCSELLSFRAPTSVTVSASGRTPCYNCTSGYRVPNARLVVKSGKDLACCWVRTDLVTSGLTSGYLFMNGLVIKVNVQLELLGKRIMLPHLNPLTGYFMLQDHIFLVKWLGSLITS